MTIYERRWRNSSGEMQSAWRVRVRTANGRTVTRQFSTKREARAFLNNPILLDTVDAAKAPFVHTAESWYALVASGDGDIPPDDATLRMYRGHLDNHVIPYFGQFMWDQITQARVEDFRDVTLERVSRSTARRILNTTKRVFRHARAKQIVVMDVSSGVAIRAARGRHVDRSSSSLSIHTPEQMRAILGALDALCERPGKRWIWLRYRTMINLAVFSGLRASELLGLARADIHLDAKEPWIEVRQRADRFGNIGPPKTAAAYRKIAIPNRVGNLIKEWLNYDKIEADLAFPTRSGSPQGHTNFVARAWNPAQEHAKVPRLNFHSVRHFYASSLIAQNLKPLQLQKIMGHSSVTFTMQVYGHLFEDLEEAAALRRSVQSLSDRVVGAEDED